MRILKEFSKHWYIVIGLLIFLYIVFYKIDLSKVFEILAQTNLFFVLLAALFIISMMVFQPIRWNYLKRIQGIKYSLKDSVLIYNAGFFFSSITPGRIGDFIKVLYLKKDGYSIGKSMVSTILDRVADVFFLFTLGYFSVLYFFPEVRKEIILLTIIGLTILVFFFLFRQNGFFKMLFNRVSKILIPSKYQKSWHLNYQDFINGLKEYKIKNYIALLFMTIVNWFFYYGSMYFLAKGIGLGDIPLFYFIGSIALAALAVLIPVSIFGLGTRDAVLLFFFSNLGISPEKTIGFSALFLFILLIATSIGFLAWLKKPLKF